MQKKLKEDVEQIVQDGERITERVREAVEDAAHRAEATPSRLSEISRAVIDSAVDAVDRSTPKEPESVLRQVVDGLTDGLQRSAQATRLAVEEAASEGRAYASEELRTVAEDFRTIADMFVDTVERGLKGASERTSAEVRRVREHAERTFKAARPAIEDAARAAARDPVSLAGESAVAAAKLTREAAGGLFSVVGRMLQSAGDVIAPRDAKGEDAKPEDEGR